MVETIDVTQIVEEEFRLLLQSAARGAYAMVSHRPTGDVTFNDQAGTAFHVPATHQTTFTEQLIPVSARDQRFLKILLYQGQAVHEAAHHIGGSELEGLSQAWTEFMSAPFFLPPRGGRSPIMVPAAGASSPIPGFEVFRPYISQMKNNVVLLTEDLRVNAYIQREYQRLFWPLLEKLIHYTRLQWLEHLDGAAHYAEILWEELDKTTASAKDKGGALGEILLFMAPSTPKYSPILSRAQTRFRQWATANGFPTNAVPSLMDTANAWRFVTESFRLWYVYQPRAIELRRSPYSDLTPIVERWWGAVLHALPEQRCFFPDTAEGFLKVVESMRSKALNYILSSFNKDASVAAYSTLANEYFARIVNLSCYEPSKHANQTSGMQPNTSKHGIIPEEGPPPPGGKQSRTEAEREEKQMRDGQRGSGSSAAEDEAERRGDGGGPSAIERAEQWLRDNSASRAAPRVRALLDEYKKQRGVA